MIPFHTLGGSGTSPLTDNRTGTLLLRVVGLFLLALDRLIQDVLTKTDPWRSGGSGEVRVWGFWGSWLRR